MFFAEDRKFVRRAGTNKGNRPAGRTVRINRVVRDPGGEVLEAEDLEKRFAPEFRVLIALLQAAGLLSKLFPAADLTSAGELAEDYWPSGAVRTNFV
ncbi:hypothetical protein [Pseudarthrobacter sp. Y6]|uniref:hypothetical protein n=1 Tax=Pseudarthrobacter sp. Y6 TaxID=3418422 RepID=UPI003CEC957D